MSIFAWVNHEIFEFMRERKFRVRTIKLRKQISQGLVISLDQASCVAGRGVTVKGGFQKYSGVNVFVEEGTDVTDLLRIKKFAISKHFFTCWPS